MTAARAAVLQINPQAEQTSAQSIARRFIDYL
jgi:hypothetical protein